MHRIDQQGQTRRLLPCRTRRTRHR